MKKARQFLFIFILSFLFTFYVQGQTMVTVSSGTTTCASPTSVWTTPPAGITFSNWSRGSGVTCANPGGGLSGSGFDAISAAASFTANKYFSVTITADANHAFTLNSITWLTSSSAVCNFDIQYSNNGGSVTTFGTTGINASSNTFNGNVVVAANTSIILYLIPWNTTTANIVRWKYNSTITITPGKYWVGYGAGGTSTQTDLAVATNWTPATTPSASDACYMNFGSYAGNFSLTQSTSGLSMNSLNITMGSNFISAALVTLTVSQNFSPGSLLITNSSSANFNDEIDFNVTGGTTICTSVQTIAGSGTSGSANPNLYINVTSSLICNGSWTSSALDYSTVSTYIKNSGTLTINGVDSVYNSKLSTAPIRFLVDNIPATTTFNGRVVLGTTNSSFYAGGNNTILLGGYNKNSTGQFIFNTNNDVIVFGYNMATENFHNGVLLFTGTGAAIGSYASASFTPDRSPGTFQIGTTIPANVSFTTTGDNTALSVYNLLLVNTSSVFTVLAAVIPSDKFNVATIQLNPNSTLNLGVNAGASATLPTNYLKYSFDATSTINFSGTNQNVYSGAIYGNVTLSNSGFKKAGASITILGSLLIKDAAVFDLNSSGFSNPNNFTDTVSGSWINNSTDPSGGIISTGPGKVTLMFNGNSNTTIGGNNPNSFYGIRIDKISGATLTMNQNLTVTNVDSFTNGALVINGNILNLGGLIITTNGTLSGSLTSNLVSGASGTVKFTQSGFSNYLKILTLNAGSTTTLGNALNIAQGTNNNCGTVTINSGAMLTTAGYLTLKSDGFGTARVANSPGNILDSVVVERFIPRGRKWRFLSVPVVTNQTINAAWQEGVVNPDVNTQVNPRPGYGTEITYNNIITNGFDPNTTINPSLKIWDYTTKAWSTYSPNTTLPINNYTAYCVFVRGSRAVNLSQGTYALQDSTVLRAKGILKQHNLSQSFSSVSTGDFVLVGNPYPSSINLTNILSNATGIDKTKFWVWDPGYGGTYGSGGYVTYSNGVMSPVTANYPAPTKIIQGGQAFFVQAGTTSGLLSFQESDKSDSERNVFARQAAPKVYPTIYTNLMVPQDSNIYLADGVAAAFGKKFSDAVDGDDAAKLWNFDENIALVRDNYTLAIEFRPIPTFTDTLFYRLYLRQQPYALKIFAQYLPQSAPVNAWLFDKYLNTKTAVDLHDTTLYNFTPNPDTNSYRNRFMLVFNRQLFTNTETVTNTIIQTNSNSSAIVSIDKTIKGSVTVFPNPAKSTDAIAVMFNNVKAGKYTMYLYDSKGNKLVNKTIVHTGQIASYFLSKNCFLPGMYNIVILKENSNEEYDLKLLIGN